MPPPPPQPLNLTIRFSTPIPDLPLTISATTTTPLALKQQIRQQRPQASAKRLRLFHHGAPLGDNVALADSLRSVLGGRAAADNGDSKGKGKGKATEPVQPPLFLLCSIGPTLPTAPSGNDGDTVPEPALPSPPPPPPPPPRPLGFDRLLASGFSPAEVAQLRAQFEAVQAHAHTPETMPSAGQLRLLEERWIDESVGPGAGAGEDGGGAAAAGSYEDMLLGTVVGFFWPLGAVVWLLREEGVWSKRRQMAVVAGMLVNVAFSVLRNTS
ncbi:MAG: hypothetical protein M1839_009061 [Geoglossum umbratile]|nr:MAG: hypothetical protein M1839_009061 [Geoglossum umbratile]